MSGTTTTPNYGLIKPNVNGDDDLWGGHINQDLDTLDALIHSIDVRPAGGVSSWNTRTGAVTMNSTDVTTALTYTPYNATNPAGYQTASDVAAVVPAPSVTTPVMDGTAAIGAGTTWARADHVHPTDTTRYAASNPAGYQTATDVTTSLVPYAPLNSPAFTGTPLLPSGTIGITQAPGNTSSALATTQFVTAAVGNVSGGATVSDTPPPGPRNGALWYDSANTSLLVSYNDGNSQQWVVANAQNALLEAPLDGSIYARRGSTASWVQAAPAAALNAVGRNLIMNPVFTVAQRGAGPWTAPAYTLDRWSMFVAGDTVSFSQIAIPDAGRAIIGDEAAQFGLSNTFTGNSAAGSQNLVLQRIENVHRLSGKTVTVSFWASAASAINLGVSIDQIFGSGGSPSPTVNGNGVAVAITPSWTRYSLTFAVPSASGKTFGTTAGTDYTQLNFWYSSGATNAVRAGIGVQSGGINLWGVQLEIGSVATPLDYGGSPQQQLAQCQRFYQTGRYQMVWGAYAVGAYGSCFLLFPVTMRATPTVTPTSGFTNLASAATANNVGPDGARFTATATAIGTVVESDGSYSASADL